MKYWLLVFTLLTQVASADTVRLADGTSCSFDSDESNIELSVSAGKGINDEYGHYGEYHRDNDGVEISLTYKFGTPERLDCKALYEMELEKRRLELQLMKKKLELLDKAKDIKW